MLNECYCQLNVKGDEDLNHFVVITDKCTKKNVIFTKGQRLESNARDETQKFREEKFKQPFLIFEMTIAFNGHKQTLTISAFQLHKDTR